MTRPFKCLWCDLPVYQARGKFWHGWVYHSKDGGPPQPGPLDGRIVVSR